MDGDGVVETAFAWTEAIASWDSDRCEAWISARVGERWTAWYSLGRGGTQRSSVPGQRDEEGSVAVDTLRLVEPADALRLRFDGEVRSAAVAYSTTPTPPLELQPGDPRCWDRLLDVPQCSQMVYPDGGEVWCSPTSVAMVVGFWGAGGTCAERVRAAVAGVRDPAYGHGNWSFNVAYAASLGYAAAVARFASLADVEPWIAAGVPVALSFAWDGDLDGAAVPRSDGHLAVLAGFDPNGDPVVNDPAAATDAEVRRTYSRAQLERRWLVSSGGTTYLIHPSGLAVPAL